MKRIVFVFIFILCAFDLPAQMKPHPRLLEQPQIHSDAPWYVLLADSVITAYSDKVLDLPPKERIIEGRRLLHTSQEVLKRVFFLSYTYRVHGGERYARRAVDEMLAASRFTDWNPVHFLDVGEMTMGLAIGYDWLYEKMTPAERKEIAGAILKKGLDAALRYPDYAWFYNSDVNWNSVCNAGLIYGALAVWEEDPEFCRQMLDKSIKSKQLAFNAFSDDGGFPEGYNYWAYGSSSQIMLEAALESAGIGEPLPEKFLRSGRFMQFMTTPSGRSFNFSDCKPEASFQHMLAWLSGKSGDTSILYNELKLLKSGHKIAHERLLPFFVIYTKDVDVLPPRGNEYHCGGVTPVYVYREGWDSPSDDYLAIKGGLAMSNHSHQDQGSFFFESDGIQWAADLGSQEYYTLEDVGLDLWNVTQDSDRWKPFRIGPWSHNIITVNGHAPKVNHKVDFSGFHEGKEHGASMDLTDIYNEDLKSYRREVWIKNGKVHVVDQLEAGDTKCSVRWAMCTEASAEVSKNRIILTAGGNARTLKASARGVDLKAAVWSASYPGPYLHDYDMPNPGHTMTGFNFELKPGQKVKLHTILSE